MSLNRLPELKKTNIQDLNAVRFVKRFAIGIKLYTSKHENIERHDRNWSKIQL